MIPVRFSIYERGETIRLCNLLSGQVTVLDVGTTVESSFLSKSTENLQKFSIVTRDVCFLVDTCS